MLPVTQAVTGSRWCQCDFELWLPEDLLSSLELPDLEPELDPEPELPDDLLLLLLLSCDFDPLPELPDDFEESSFSVKRPSSSRG